MSKYITKDRILAIALILFTVLIIALIVWGCITYVEMDDRYHILEAEKDWLTRMGESEENLPRITELTIKMRDIYKPAVIIVTFCTFGILLAIGLIIYLILWLPELWYN